jgi:hypothetical protein
MLGNFIKNKDRFISEYRNRLSEDECNYIIECIESCELCSGTIGNSSVRKEWKDSSDKAMFFDSADNPISKLVLPKLLDCLQEYKKEHPELDTLGLWQINTIYNAQRYFPGQFYAKIHCEAGGYTVSQRMLVWMLYLNNVKDGGETEFPVLKQKTKAETGKFVIWPASWTHMHNGIVSKKEKKYILTGWFSFVFDDSDEKNENTN